MIGGIGSDGCDLDQIGLVDRPSAGGSFDKLRMSGNRYVWQPPNLLAAVRNGSDLLVQVRSAAGVAVRKPKATVQIQLGQP